MQFIIIKVSVGKINGQLACLLYLSVDHFFFFSPLHSDIGRKWLHFVPFRTNELGPLMEGQVGLLQPLGAVISTLLTYFFTLSSPLDSNSNSNSKRKERGKKVKHLQSSVFGFQFKYLETAYVSSYLVSIAERKWTERKWRKRREQLRALTTQYSQTMAGLVNKKTCR